jgi:hypothetical protein
MYFCRKTEKPKPNIYESVKCVVPGEAENQASQWHRKMGI